MIFNAFWDELLDKPSCDLLPFCAICGRPASNRHHLIQKGMGGVSRETERRIPKIRLCGMGNIDGCHGAIHQQRLHVYWDDGYVFLFTEQPMNHQECWELNKASYLPVPGWEEQMHGLPHVYGRKS